MLDKISEIEKESLEEISKVTSLEALEEIRVKVMGKKGSLTEILKSMKDLSVEEKKEVGKVANVAKDKISQAIDSKKEELDSKGSGEKFFDYTYSLPETVGTYHPITKVQQEIEGIFQGMGFIVDYGNEVVTEFENFTSVNVPEDHPARDMQDTFWLDNGELLRTQTSAQQVNVMKKYGAPFKAIVPGRTFRNEKVDASHENTFFQLEGMLVDEKVSVANLIYFMRELLSKVLDEKDLEVRLRPGFFPFVEPGFELDMKCKLCGGTGCRTCKGSGWIEMLPCGMIHPNVLKAGGIDTDKYTGFAFGLGLTRLAMMKYGIKEIREMNSMDIRKLGQIR